MSASTGKQKTERLASRFGLEGKSKDSFLRLCVKGCDAGYLAEYLSFLTPKTDVTITPKNSHRKPYKINLRPLDSDDVALNGFEERDLKALQKQLLKYAEKIEKLNLSSLVRYIDDSEYETDIFKVPHLLIYYAKGFIPLLLKRYELTGKKLRPQYTEYLNKIIDHVEQSTGEPHYALISDVLFDFGVDTNEEALKQWRFRNKPPTEATT